MDKSDQDFNQKIINLFQELQYQIVFSRYIGLGFAKICFAEDENSIYWNYAFTNQLLSKDQLLEIENEFKDLKREPLIYFENRDDLFLLKEFLDEYGYTKQYEESWMFYDENVVEQEDFKHIKKVENEKDLEIFLETFDKCYQKDDPQNPYGELAGYKDAARKAWIDTHDEKMEYFIGYKDSEPVAVAALTSYEGLGYIANVGSLKKVRGEGFGKLITMYCVWKSEKNGNVFHFLGTEENTYPFEFYKRIGFKKKYSTVGYGKHG